MPWRVVFAGRAPDVGVSKRRYIRRVIIYLAEINRPHLEQCSLYAGLSLMVWILKREVRAFGGCLGMYRRRRTWHAAISVGEL